MKKENFNLADVNQDLRKLAVQNKDYLLDAKDFKKKYRPCVNVYEYNFRKVKPDIADNKVSVNGIRIGTIKKGSLSHFRKLLADPNYSHCEVEIGGGKYRTINLDGNGNLRLQKCTARFYATLSVYIKTSSGILSRLFAK